MSTSTSPYKPQETLEYACTIAAVEINKQYKRAYIVVRIKDKEKTFPTTIDGEGHGRLEEGNMMYIDVERDSPFAVLQKDVTIVCSRDMGSGRGYGVFVECGDFGDRGGVEVCEV